MNRNHSLMACTMIYSELLIYAGASGIATGWSTLVHTYHPLDVLANVSSMINISNLSK